MRKPIIIISGCIAMLLLGYTGYRGYQVWKQNHWLVMAKGFAAKVDVRNEALCLQQALRLNPHNLEACRLMANLADALRSQGALIWRQRVVELNPGSLEDRLALAETAINFNDYNVAASALAGVDDTAKKTAAYQNAAGMLAFASRRLSEAEMHFAEAARLEPENPILQLNLAVVKLDGTNELDMAEARINLKRISLNSTNFAVRIQAQRQLAMDALRFNDLNTALPLTKELAQPTNAIFSDRILRLDTLRLAKSPEFKTSMATYEREAAANPAKLSDMAIWLMQKNSPGEALVWLQSLPTATQTNQPAALLAAQCQVQLHNWQGMQASLKNQNWDSLDFLRHALLARALREEDLSGASTAEWGVAVRLASNEKGSLISLFQLAAEFQWNSEAEELLWNIVNKCPEEQWAVPTLTQALIAGGRTRPLMQLFGIQLKRHPADLETKNNLALVAMLLEAQELNPYDLAQEVYSKTPQNASYASTYAFSLYLQKKYAEALKIMQQLPPKDLDNPSIAGYYGLILKASGNNVKAAAYLQRAIKSRLLPEERTLFEQASH